jgi:hypothetical protein
VNRYVIRFDWPGDTSTTNYSPSYMVERVHGGATVVREGATAFDKRQTDANLAGFREGYPDTPWLTTAEEC